MPENPDFSARLASIEKQLRLWKAATLLVVLGLVTLGAAAFTQDVPFSDPGSGLYQVPARRIMANNFVLVGQDGKVYAKLTTRDGNAVLNLYDQNGRVIWSAPPKLNAKPLAE